MVMLILETFLLMLLSALLGTALGRLLGEAYGDLLSTDRPWLREPAASPAAPVLPPAPTLLADDERARLAASLTPTADVAVAAAPAAAAAAEPVSAPAEIARPAASAPAPSPAGASTSEVPPASEDRPATAEVEPPAAAEAPSGLPASSQTDAGRAAEADAHGTRPLGLAAPRDGRADDLKRIRGIGRQNEARLNGLGVWHFDQIAAWTPENVRWAGSFLAFQGRIEREDWVGQAKILTSGGTTEFAARVDAGEVPTSSA